MSAVLLLEAPGRWRAVVATSLLLLAVIPLLPLGSAALSSPGEGVGDAFWQSLGASAEIALAGAFIGFAIGLPLGVGSAVTAFAGKRLLLVAISLPLVLPSFLWTIGWAMLAVREPLARTMTGGSSGCVVVAATMTTPLVALASYAGVLDLSRSQLESALLAGGGRTLLRRAARHASLPAVVAAALGAVLSLSDPGPGQILGVHTVAAEILTSFAARYDLGLAARQCALLTVVVAILALPLAYFGGPRLARATLARQLAVALPERRGPLRIAVALAGGTFLALAVIPPIVGLLRPLVSGAGPVARDVFGLSEEAWTGYHLDLAFLGALSTAGRTALNTIVYACGAGALATLVAAAAAVTAGRSPGIRRAAVGACIALFSWPSVASALAIAQLGASAPPMLDFLLRSRFTVCLVLALHFAPIATVLLLRATAGISPSSAYAAAVFGVPPRRYLVRVLLPALLPSAALSVGLVGLFASADAASVLLLHPPGEASLALAIVTVMANAPEVFVAALCLVYLAGALALLAAVLGIAARYVRRR